MSFPKISIITPSFNQAKFLEETILSVLNQGYPNLEYIIIDGGSTDTSVEIIKKYEKQLSYWVSEKDSGQSEAINKGLRKASGEIVAWLNSDDLYCENTLKHIGSLFLEHPEAGIIYGDVMNFREDTSEMRVVNQFEIVDFFSRISLHQPSIFWRRELLAETDLLDETLYYCMDYDLWMKLFLNYTSLKVDAVFSLFREHSSSKTNSKPIALYLEYQKVVSRFFNSLALPRWKEKLLRSGIQSDPSTKRYLLKKQYSEKTLQKLFLIFLETSLNIAYTQGSIGKVNILFYKNPRLFLDLKSILIFIKTNSPIVLFKKNKFNA